LILVAKLISKGLDIAAKNVLEGTVSYFARFFLHIRDDLFGRACELGQRAQCMRDSLYARTTTHTIISEGLLEKTRQRCANTKPHNHSSGSNPK
jgi:hypothetical protein